MSGSGDIRPAIAAATAILDAGGAHDKTMEAAEFLVMQTVSEPDADRHISRGAHVLLARAPDDDRWPAMWLYLALSQNDGHDRSPLDMLESRMTPAQIAEAQRLADEWREAHGR